MDERHNRATSPFDEKARLAELRSLDILDTPPEVRFDRYTRLVAQIFKVPMAIISLIDEDRQWFKSSVGVKVRETPLDESFCVHAIEHDLLEIADALVDDVFCHHKAVVGSPFVRFYAGTVLRGPTGQPLGTLCILDTSPRQLTDMERSWLVTFGHLVEELIIHQATLAIVRQRMNHVTQRNTRTGSSDEMLFGNTITNLMHLADKDDHFLALLRLRLNNLH
ncbi:GAF domain-containing protein [Halomonas sp. TRM85114]|uniref:GAF domain-containing protein n=1 Tax=Halomonas jincaotanensis TaxID=2810616 RepID=UPI001BD1EA1F|nr:GAF domain-containing protein [Halomonas jincaotanensis]MBS9405602.1 GAF domain-containing protein [Halomonas jincaotanensis]